MTGDEETLWTIEPFKGPESYSSADRRLFFGRAEAARRVREMVLAHRLSLLHAPSGAGKSSMVRAALIPTIEENYDWIAPISKPMDDPIEGIRIATLDRIFPKPSLEAQAARNLQKAAQQLGVAGGFERYFGEPDAPLETVLRHFGNLVEATGGAAEASGSAASAVPRYVLEGFLSHVLDQSAGATVIQRSLNSENGLRLLARHLACLQEWCRFQGLNTDWMNPLVSEQELSTLTAQEFVRRLSNMPFRSLIHLFETESLNEAWSLFAKEYSKPNLSLPDFFQALHIDWFQMRVFGCDAGVGLGPALGLVIVLDQFEELFTQEYFGRGGAHHEAGLELFRQIEDIYLQRRRSTVGLRRLDARVHVLLSMRDEHIAQLDQIRSYATDLDRASHRLYFFNEPTMKDIIERTCDRYGFTIEEHVLRALLDDLPRADGSFEPLLMQIVLLYLWRHHGRKIRRTLKEGKQVGIAWSDFKTVGGTSQILQNYLLDFVQKHEEAPRTLIEKFEIYSILQDLIGEGRRRKIHEEISLINEPGHSKKIRQAVLAEMVISGIVRRERRIVSDGMLVEISHERLCQTGDEVLRSHFFGDQRMKNLQNASLRLHSTLLSEARGSTSKLLSIPDVEVLTEVMQNAPNAEFDLETAALELILRSVIQGGLKDETVRYWANKFDAANILIGASENISGVTTDIVDMRRMHAKGWPGLDPVDAGSAEINAMIRSLLMHASHRADLLMIQSFARRFGSG